MSHGIASIAAGLMTHQFSPELHAAKPGMDELSTGPWSRLRPWLPGLFFIYQRSVAAA